MSIRRLGDCREDLTVALVGLWPISWSSSFPARSTLRDAVCRQIQCDVYMKSQPSPRGTRNPRVCRCLGEVALGLQEAERRRRVGLVHPLITAKPVAATSGAPDPCRVAAIGWMSFHVPALALPIPASCDMTPGAATSCTTFFTLSSKYQRSSFHSRSRSSASCPSHSFTRSPTSTVSTATQIAIVKRQERDN